jgi:DNA-binding NarL/FixJ family response regulator
MLVEDNISFRSVLKTMLSAHIPTLRISEADGKRKALDICKNNMPDLILMDLTLANGGGLTLTRQIKQFSPATVVIVVTNHDSQEYEKAAYQSGADGFISKRSASPDEIIRIVKSIASNKLPETK